MNYTRNHLITLSKYLGMSFITGAIAHGFFSGTRQLITAGIGILFFVIATLLEEKTEKSVKNFFLATGLAIALGAFTGGLQHFPDSPERSVWVFPLGFTLSALFFLALGNFVFSRKHILYIILGTLFSSALSYAGFLYFQNQSISNSYTNNTSQTGTTLTPQNGPGDGHTDHTH